MSEAEKESEKEPTVRKITDRLAGRFPDAPKTFISGIVEEEYDSMDTGRIRIYIPTLIENCARNRLHQDFETKLTLD